MIDFLGIEKEHPERLEIEDNDDALSQVMAAIEWFFAYHSKSPTVREILARTQYTSTKTVADTLDKLEEMGYIKRNKQLTRRTIQLTDKRFFF